MTTKIQMVSEEIPVNDKQTDEPGLAIAAADAAMEHIVSTMKPASYPDLLGKVAALTFMTACSQALLNDVDKAKVKMLTLVLAADYEPEVFKVIAGRADRE